MGPKVSIACVWTGCLCIMAMAVNWPTLDLILHTHTHTPTQTHTHTHTHTHTLTPEPPSDSYRDSRCLPQTQIPGNHHRTRQLGACVGHHSGLCGGVCGGRWWYTVDTDWQRSTSWNLMRAVDQKPECHLEWPYKFTMQTLIGSTSCSAPYKYRLLWSMCPNGQIWSNCAYLWLL